MRIMENNEIGYSIEDIVNSINDELGFSMVKIDDITGYFMLGSGIKLNIVFEEVIQVDLELPHKDYDLSEDTSELDILASAIDSTQQILDIIERMTD